MILTESKRDDLLLPYYQLVLKQGMNISFKEFKGGMLDKLAAQGGMHNLSLSSNYYLAGAVKYYFNGDLTLDGKANFISGKPDNWNVEICKRLNALINILRNAYIDSVGTTFEQPEDFGTLSLPKLLRKYGKKIDAELGIGNETEKEESGIDRSNRVGNGYTFDILYTYEQATKYNQYTSPGAWCITYGQGHYNNYKTRLGIHYVIFRKDGFENIPREHDENFTPHKPHDAYGNSLIAFLQSNKDWKGTYITSRWNHGYGEYIEADHAYTNEEFMQITGVSVEDLERIHEIWKEDRKNYSSNCEDANSKSEIKVASINAVRKLKYAQIKINGGEDIETAIESVGGEKSFTALGDGEQAKKNVSVYGIKDGDVIFKFIVDKGKILFESLQQNNAKFNLLNENMGGAFGNTILIETERYSMLYNARYHEFLNIGGAIKFKKIPNFFHWRESCSTISYFIVKNGMRDFALVSSATMRPIKLPNGQYWSNVIVCPSHSEIRSAERRTDPWVIFKDECSIIEMIYDESSREKYFFNLNTGKFVDISLPVNTDTASASPRGLTPDKYELALGHVKDKNAFSLYFSSKGDSSSSTYATPEMVFDTEGRILSFYGQHKFPFGVGRSETGRFLAFAFTDIPSFKVNEEFERAIYDMKMKKIVAIGDKPLKTYGYSFWYSVRNIGNGLYELRCLDFEGKSNASVLYNGEIGKVVNKEYTNAFNLRPYWDENQEEGTVWLRTDNPNNRTLYYNPKAGLEKFRIDELKYFDNTFPQNDEYEVYKKTHLCAFKNPEA